MKSGEPFLARPKKLQKPEAIQDVTGDPTWLTAVRAAESKQARDIVVLDVRGETSFSDHFLICSGASTRQVQAIADEIGLKLKERGEKPSSIEGYKNSEWVLLDYGDFVVHVFSPKARTYYDLERLWRDARVVEWTPDAVSK